MCDEHIQYCMLLHDAAQCDYCSADLLNSPELSISLAGDAEKTNIGLKKKKKTKPESVLSACCTCDYCKIEGRQIQYSENR